MATRLHPLTNSYSHTPAWTVNTISRSATTYVCRPYSREITGSLGEACALRPVPLYSLVGIYWRFESAYCLRFQGMRMVLYPEHGSSTFFRYSTKLLTRLYSVICHETVISVLGRAVAQAVSRWLPTAAARVRSRVWSSGICGGESGVGASFLRFLLPIFILPIAPQSPSPIIWVWYNRPEVTTVQGLDCMRGRPSRPLHRDLQWSVALYKGLNPTPLAIKKNLSVLEMRSSYSSEY
jgi:hypothetical protein